MKSKFLHTDVMNYPTGCGVKQLIKKNKILLDKTNVIYNALFHILKKKLRSNIY